MESKIRCFRVRVPFYYLYLGSWLVSSPSLLFLSPPSILSSSLLKFFPYSTMSSSTINVTLAMPLNSHEEVWGMDNKDFHDGSDPLVRGVKRSGFCLEADLMLDQFVLSCWGEHLSASPHQTLTCGVRGDCLADE